MNFRMVAILLLASNFAFTSVSQAQMWGTGMYGGMPICPYPYGAAKGSTSYDDEIAELQDLRREMRQELRDAKRRLRDLERRKDQYASDINDTLTGFWAPIVLDHMENGYNCFCHDRPPVYEGGGCPRPDNSCGPSYPVEEEEEEEEYVVPKPSTTHESDEGCVDGICAGSPDDDEGAVPKPIKGLPEISSAEPVQQRMPASVSRAPASIVSGSEIDAINSAWSSIGGGFGGGGAGFMASFCNPNKELQKLEPWKAICRNGGGISPMACRHPFFLQDDAKKGNMQAKCVRALENYRKISKEIDKLRNLIAKLEDDINQIGEQIGDLRRDRKYDSELEASCPSGDCYRPRQRVEARNSTWNTLLPLIAGTVVGGLAEYFGYKANKANNENLNKLGWPTMPYQFGQYGYPFFAAGLYGAISAGTQGGFGCAPGMFGGGLQMGPYGMVSPVGMMSPFGMQNPFMTPYSMASPFGYPMGVMGYSPFVGGMFAPGMGPWGMAGPWGNGFNPMLGFGMAGGLMGMPGMGAGFMVPAMGGMPVGLAGGVGLMGMPGLAGGIGLMGMPGLAGGLADLGGLQMQQQLLQMQMQQYQMALQVQAQAAQQAAARLRAQQSLMAEYYSLVYRMQMLNYGATYGLGLDVGLGTSTGLTGTIGIGTMPIGTTPIGTTPIGTGTTVPGRTR